jgi:hypothetical protein
MGEEYITAYPDNRERVAPEKVYKNRTNLITPTMVAQEASSDSKQ